MKLRSFRKSPLLPWYGSSFPLQALLERERAMVFLACGAPAVVALGEGASALLGGPRLTLVWVVALVVTAAYGWYHLRYVQGALQRLERATQEAQIVRARLSGAAVAGARIFFDVPCGQETVPAVILSPHGAYAAHVWMAPNASGRIKVAIDDSRFRFAGTTIAPNPMRLASDSVQPLQQVLRIGRTDDVIVHPLIVIAGTAIELERHQGVPDVPVIAIEALDDFIRSQPEQLSVVEVTMHAMRLAAHIRDR